MFPNLTNINKEEILIELENYQLYLDDATDTINADINSLMEKGSRLLEIYSRTSKIHTDYTYIYSKTLKNDIMNIINESYGKYLSKEVQKMLANTYLAEEQFIMNWAERLMRNSLHQADMIRTFISKEKAEMQYLNYVNNRK